MAAGTALIRRTWLNSVPATLVLMGLSLLGLGATQIADSARALSSRVAADAAAPKHGRQAPEAQIEDLAGRVNDLELRRQALKDRLDAISQQAGQNQWLLSIVLAAAGLLTLAQGAFAFFGTQGYVKQADDAVERIKTLAEEVRAKYPVFSQMEDTLEAAFRRLAELARHLDLDQNLYADSDPRTRQEILALESFAAMQFVSAGVRAPQIVTNIRLLGKFYADKYLAAGKGLETDFDRALYYFNLELEKSNRDILALNDLGWLYMQVARVPDADGARAFFLESLDRSPHQQRPLYNLGTILVDRLDKAKLEKARQYLEKAASVRNWEKTPNEEFSCHVHYNLACTYARLSEHEQDAANKKLLLDLALSALDKAAEKGGTAEKILENDLQKDDLVAVAASPEHTAQLLAMKQKFRQAWTARAKI
jgi:hypothetical protein